MKKIVLIAFACVSLNHAFIATAQSKKSAPAPIGSFAADGFLLRDNAVVLRMGAFSAKAQQQDVALSKDVVLANGTKIEHQSAIVRYTDGRQVALREGDFVSMSGDVKLAKSGKLIKAAPAPAAAPPTPEPAAASASAAFTYEAAEPVNGKLKGVVELGASGFNSFVVRMDAERRWKLEKAEFGNSLVMENLATEDDVRRGLKSYIGQMLDFGVGARDIHFVVSSGAAKAESTSKIVEALKELSYVVNVVTPEEEGAAALRAALPIAYADKAFVVDMGSANTKITWLQDGRTTTAETHGAKYFQQSLADSAVAAEVRQQAQKVPTALRNTCFIVGGVPYELAKTVRQGQERYITLGSPESYSQLSAAKTKAGLNIYRALAEATGCKQFIFDSDVNFTIGYLLNLPQ